MDQGQTELVTLQNQNAGVAEVLADRKASSRSSSRNRCSASIAPPLSPTIPLLPSHPLLPYLRMDAQHESRVKALRELGRASDHMHLEMGKINRLVNEHAEKQQVLADDSFLMEAEFAQKLKGLEVEAVGIEAKIVALKQEKEEGMLVDTTEAQKQAALSRRRLRSSARRRRRSTPRWARRRCARCSASPPDAAAVRAAAEAAS